MEFKAIIDPKSRVLTDCAVVGVYENGDLGVAARNIDAQIGGLIKQLHSGGDFAAKTGDTLLLPRPAGAASARVLLVGLGTRAGFDRKQYRKALLVERSGARQDRCRRCRGVLGAGGNRRRRRAIPRAHGGRNLQRAGLQDSRPEVRCETKAGQALERQRGRGERARGEGDRHRPQDRRRNRQRDGHVARFGESAAQHLYPHLYRPTRRKPRQGVAAHQDQGNRRERHQGLENGCIPRGHARLGAAAAADRLRVSRRQEGRAHRFA